MRRRVSITVDRRSAETAAAEELERHAAAKAREVELDRLRRAAEVRHAEDRLVAELAQIREHLAIAGTQERQFPAAEGVARLAHGEHALHPVEQRSRLARLRFHVHRFVAVDRVHDRREVQALRIAAREAGVAVRGPLHRRPDAVPVAEEDVVAHADLVAVVDDGRSGHREEQAVHQLDRVAVCTTSGPTARMPG